MRDFDHPPWQGKSADAARTVGRPPTAPLDARNVGQSNASSSPVARRHAWLSRRATGANLRGPMPGVCCLLPSVIMLIVGTPLFGAVRPIHFVTAR